jgi:biopolymer transport protein ExbD
MNHPHINVTPLIDVLLVLLIIFMVVTPLKPSSFKARVPSEPDHMSDVRENPDTLVAVIEKDHTIRLNKDASLGTTADTPKLTARLSQVFEQRAANGNVSQSFADDPDRPLADRIERTVFIKAPRSMDYGSVARVVDAVKLAGAYPISLQIDDLDSGN